MNHALCWVTEEGITCKKMMMMMGLVLLDQTKICAPLRQLYVPSENFVAYHRYKSIES